MHRSHESKTRTVRGGPARQPGVGPVAAASCRSVGCMVWTVPAGSVMMAKPWRASRSSSVAVVMSQTIGVDASGILLPIGSRVGHLSASHDGGMSRSRGAQYDHAASVSALWRRQSGTGFGVTAHSGRARAPRRSLAW